MSKMLMSLLIFVSSVSYAVAATDTTQNWICTTNASSSDNAVDKAADDQMVQNKGSAVTSFTFAEQNCRDCTKITCEVNQ